MENKASVWFNTYFLTGFSLVFYVASNFSLNLMKYIARRIDSVKFSGIPDKYQSTTTLINKIQDMRLIFGFQVFSDQILFRK